MEKTPEEILATEFGGGQRAEEVRGVSVEEIEAREDSESDSVSDAFSDADEREERIELRNDAIDELVDEAQEVSEEGIDGEGPG